MNVDDFRYMIRGKVVKTLPEEDSCLLEPIVQEGPGRERALLLLHGFSSTPAVYRRFIPTLMMYDAVMCPVLPGHGDSIDAFSKARAVDWFSSVEAACEQLLKAYSFVDVMGLSLGGLLACHLSTRYRLNHLFLLAPALRLCLNIPLTLLAARSMYVCGLRRIQNHAGNLFESTYPELAYRQVPVASIIEILNLIHTFQWQAPTCPTDVFLGRHDEVVDSNQIAARFANLPHTSIHWLEHSAHVLPLDGDVDEITACVRDSMASHKNESE